jgi:hypothetical protein
MSDQDHGPNVRRLAYLDQRGGPSTRLSEEPGGSWTAVPAGGPESDDEISRGATPELAAAARIAWLEDRGVYIPEPPDDFLRPRRLDGKP